jgi:hypothetical protein
MTSIANSGEIALTEKGVIAAQNAGLDVSPYEQSGSATKKGLKELANETADKSRGVLKGIGDWAKNNQFLAVAGLTTASELLNPPPGPPDVGARWGVEDGKSYPIRTMAQTRAMDNKAQQDKAVASGVPQTQAPPSIPKAPQVASQGGVPLPNTAPTIHQARSRRTNNYG